MFWSFLNRLFNKPKIKTIQRNKLQALMLDCRKTMELTFRKKDGQWRTVIGQVEYVQGHNQFNRAAHMGKYVTLVVDRLTNPQWKNVNLETVSHINIGNDRYIVEGKLFD